LELPAALEPWLIDHISARGPLDVELIAAGRSNLTFSITDAGGQRWALRRPPEGLTVASAHDVVREARIMRALGPSAVPVPVVSGVEPAGDVIGAPFFVMEFVEGAILRGRKQSGLVDLEVRARASQSIVESLVAIHGVDLDTAGLADLAPATGYLERQMERWYDSYQRVTTEPVAAVDEVLGWLRENQPDSPETTLVHGDYRLDNAIVDQAGNVLAILDWEIATLGDPVADLALMVAYWAGEGDEAVGPAALPGFLDRQGVVDAYAKRSGRDLGALGWHLVLAYWKLACISAQIQARYARGGGGGDRSRLEGLQEQTRRFAERAQGMIELAQLS
jgi:aminoglycoside phosphotransferase (APT) family kinase protein